MKECHISPPNRDKMALRAKVWLDMYGLAAARNGESSHAARIILL